MTEVEKIRSMEKELRKLKKEARVKKLLTKPKIVDNSVKIAELLKMVANKKVQDVDISLEDCVIARRAEAKQVCACMKTFNWCYPKACSQVLERVLIQMKYYLPKIKSNGHYYASMKFISRQYFEQNRDRIYEQIIKPIFQKEDNNE